MNKLMLIFAFVLPAALAAAPLKSVPMENLPRKVLVGTMSRHFSGTAEQRCAQVREWIGKVADEAAQVEGNEKVLTGEIDLSYALLHWSATLRGGQKFIDAYGRDSVGFRYRQREDNGIFWSNDPKRTIGDMMRGIELHTRDFSANDAKRVQDMVRK